MAKKKIDFFIESLKTIKQSGTITQSGPALCKAMTEHIKPSHKYILEIGAGDGAVTKHILRQMSPDAVLLSFEINETHFESLTAIKDPRLIPILDSAEYIEKHLIHHNIDCLDTIISSIPFVVLPTELTLGILNCCKENLNDGEIFVQYHYSKALKSLYEGMFRKVDVDFVLLNAPPAFVFRCQK